jgi:peptide/nickel transport system permease protein
MRQKHLSYWSAVWKRLCHDRMVIIGISIILVMFLIALMAPLLANNKALIYRHNSDWSLPVFSDDYDTINFRTMEKGENDFWIMPLIPYSPYEYELRDILLAPSYKHFLGTDDQGRDVASRMIHGCRISISVGFVAVALYVLIGIFIGALAGYYGGWMDIVISRIIEVVICFPVFFLILTVLAFVGPSIYSIMIVIGLTSWTGIARLVRGEFLKNRLQEYVQAARIIGMPTGRIMWRHILPNSMAPVFVSATFGIAGAILIESSLSFLGFGVQPPTPSWGDILSQSRSYIDIAWWLTLFPGIAIFMTITAYNLVGEGLRDAIDPRLRGTEVKNT